MKKPRDPGEERHRSTMDDVLEDFRDRRISSSSSSSRKRSRKMENNDVRKKAVFRSETIYAARHPEVGSWLSTTTTPEFDEFEKFWEGIDRDCDSDRRRRERDREAARVAIDGIQETANLENNRNAVKELESICGCSSNYVLGRNPLMNLGLSLKPEYSDINGEDEEAVLFGDIHRTQKPCIHVGRSIMQHKAEQEEHGTKNIRHCSSGSPPSCGQTMSSPRKDHDRVAMLKLRYKDTIRKAQKALCLPIDDDKQQGIDSKTTEVRSWSTTTVPEFDQFVKFREEIDRDQLRRRRERDREAARVAVDEIRDTACWENNQKAVQELESICECSSYYVLGRGPLNSLGLFLKPEYSDITDEDKEAILFEDIRRTKKPHIHMGRSIQHKLEKEEYGSENIKHYSTGSLLNSTIEAAPSCGHATSSQRKEADRVEMLKSTMDTMLKAQKTLGFSADYNKQHRVGLETTARRSRYCRSQATINAPARGATLPKSSRRKEADGVGMLKSSMDTILKAQKALGSSADYGKQQGVGSETTSRRRGSETTSRRRHHCRSKATINAPVRGAALA